MQARPGEAGGDGFPGPGVVLDRSASYVLQRPDGSYVTFTRLLGAAKRSVCLISKDQHASVCIDWDSNWKQRAAAE